MQIKFPTAPKDELGLIGCCLVGGLDVSMTAVEAMAADAFYDERLRQIFTAIESLATAGQPVNTYTIDRYWTSQRHGKAPLDLLMQAESHCPSAENLPLHIEGMREAWRKRKLMITCYEILQQGQAPQAKADALMAQVESALYAEEVKTVKVCNSKESCQILVEDLERRFQLRGALSGVGTGFLGLDLITNGLQYGEQSIIGARPSMGKTALGLNIIQHACFISAVPTLFVSLEMSVAAVMRRFLSGSVNVRMNDIRNGGYTEEQFRQFTTFSSKASKAPFWCVDGVRGMNINQVTAVIRRYCRKHQIQLVVVDYLQKIKPAERQEKRTYEIGDVSGQLKALAVDTGAAFLTLAQLNRENEKDKGRRPRMSDLADSAQIERDADTIGFIHRDRSQPEETTELIIAKQRDGEIGIIELNFNGPYCRFENPATEQPE